MNEQMIHGTDVGSAYDRTSDLQAMEPLLDTLHIGRCHANVVRLPEFPATVFWEWAPHFEAVERKAASF